MSFEGKQAQHENELYERHMQGRRTHESEEQMTGTGYDDDSSSDSESDAASFLVGLGIIGLFLLIIVL